MSKKSLFISCCLFFIGIIGSYAQYTPEENFDKDWLFYNAEAEGAEKTDFDDSKWRKLNLPHDWAIEGPFDRKYDLRMGGLPVHGTGWYRKHFTMSPEAKGKVVRMEFEGAMYDAQVWVNGEMAGNRPYGYIGFEFDISKHLKYDGSDNVVAVRLTPVDYSSRWYPGAGLYRSVWLKIDDPVHVDNWGTYITTPTVTEAKAVVQNETTIVNKSDEDRTITINHTYLDKNGIEVAKSSDNVIIKSNSKAWSGTFTNIENPMLWNVERPNLYSVITSISEGDQILDTFKSTFGIRSIRYTPDGFFLNNKPIKFNGVCLHHDNGALGAAVYRRADERKLQILKEMGVNAIRTSHNPPSRTFLELCDDMGLLVLDEAFDVWKIEKVTNGYNLFFEEWWERDLTDMILRDRNHPSVVMWSIGNEIKEQHKPDIGWKMAEELHNKCIEIDPTRPTTLGFNSYPAAYVNNMAQQVDIAGINYKPSKYAELRDNYPEMAFYASETSSCYSSRGVYHFPLEKYDKHESLQQTSYDFTSPPWGYPPDIEFHFQKLNPHVMGEFVWTGFDYLGETSPYGGLDNTDDRGHWNSDWPSRSSYFGIVDLAGFPKDRYYLYQSEWTDDPMIHLLPHWNWKGMEGNIIPVYCYTNCDEAELFLNGKSLGRKVKGKDKTTLPINFIRYEPKTFNSPYRLSWDVPYEAGTLKVVGYKNGLPTQEKIIKTAGAPAKISLSVDRSTIDADGRDLAYVTITIQDKDGNFCPLADNLIKFEVDGVGKIVGVDNGNPISIESFQAPQRKAFNGLALAIIKSDIAVGTIKLKAFSKGLKSDTIEIEVKNSSTN